MSMGEVHMNVDAFIYIIVQNSLCMIISLLSMEEIKHRIKNPQQELM